METLALFVPITKVDAERRLVYGTLTEEIPDKSGEILDYETAKPEFQKWSDEIRAGSGGKSLGNVRAMHSNVAAGKLVDIAFDDDAKKIEGIAQIVDDDEWEKVMTGVYTGFSMGGRYLARWPDSQNPDLMRYTPQPCEVSLVDNPCVPSATFTLIKADGSVERRAFLGMRKVGMRKVGARHSRADLARVQKLHDLAHRMEKCAGLMKATALGLGAAPAEDDGEDATADDDDMEMPDGGEGEAVENQEDGAQEDGEQGGNIAAAMAQAAAHKAVAAQLAVLQKRIADLEAQPLPMKGVANSAHLVAKRFAAIGKGGDIGSVYHSGHDTGDLAAQLAALPQDERAKLLMKVALATPNAGLPR